MTAATSTTITHIDSHHMDDDRKSRTLPYHVRKASFGQVSETTSFLNQLISCSPADRAKLTTQML